MIFDGSRLWKAPLGRGFSVIITSSSSFLTEWGFHFQNWNFLNFVCPI